MSEVNKNEKTNDKKINTKKALLIGGGILLLGGAIYLIAKKCGTKTATEVAETVAEVASEIASSI